MPEPTASSVSVVICAHNSAGRLPRVLAALAEQQAQVPWEVLVVDNASSDDTGRVASERWARHDVELRVVREPKIGLVHARARARVSAHHDLVSFVDDDNIVGPGWVQGVADVAHAHPNAGAIGGRVDLDDDVGPTPGWFPEFAQAFAVGTQGDPGDVTDARGYVWGAGLTVRRDAWDELTTAGFLPINTGRQGKRQLSGEDSELCMALRLRGWRIRYEPQLRMRHALDPARLTWPALLDLYWGFGHASPGHDPYEIAHQLQRESGRRVPSGAEERRHLRQFLRQRPMLLLPWVRRRRVGDRSVCEVARALGRLRRLIQMGDDYDRIMARVVASAWTEDGTQSRG